MYALILLSTASPPRAPSHHSPTPRSRFKKNPTFLSCSRPPTYIAAHDYPLQQLLVQNSRAVHTTSTTQSPHCSGLEGWKENFPALVLLALLLLVLLLLLLVTLCLLLLLLLLLLLPSSCVWLSWNARSLRWFKVLGWWPCDSSPWLKNKEEVGKGQVKWGNTP